jgi:ankyrin repeat protein
VSLAAADSAPVSQESDRSNKKSTIPSPKLNADEKSLRRAIINLDLASVKKIIDKAPTLANIPVNDSGQTALHLAAELGSSELLTYLLSKDSDPNIEDEAGLTPLHLVNSSQAFSLILKSKNMNLQKKTGNADTILHHFARRFPLLDEDILKYMRKV